VDIRVYDVPFKPGTILKGLKEKEAKEKREKNSRGG